MAGFLALGNDQYIGSLKLAQADGVENGLFVEADFVAGTASLPTGDADGDVFFVANEIETIDVQGIDDVDYVVADGKYLRLKKPVGGEVFVTTKFTEGLTKGAEVAVGTGGVVSPVGARTPKYKFVVKELTTAYGTSAVELLAL